MVVAMGRHGNEITMLLLSQGQYRIYRLTGQMMKMGIETLRLQLTDRLLQTLPVLLLFRGIGQVELALQAGREPVRNMDKDERRAGGFRQRTDMPEDSLVRL
jgi:hypothetical protein